MAEDTRLEPTAPYKRPTVVDPLWDKAFQLALRVSRNRRNAEDAASDARAAVWKKQDEDPGFPPSTDALERFIQTAVSNWYRMKWRKKKVRLKHEPSVAYELETHRSAVLDPEVTEESLREEEVRDAEVSAYRLALIKGWLDTLPPERRRLFNRRHFDEASFAEIAKEEWGTPGAMRTSFYEILRSMRSALRGEPVPNQKETT
jgi:DNA-directed RNA polymerase specialized sigma24 family protein